MRTRPLPVSVAAVLMAVLSIANLLSPLMPSEGVPRRSSLTLVLCWAFWVSSSPPDCGCSSGGICG
jgi:hypothetical protein